ncbi:hypothetical protein B0T09DRAFT_347841 [Sordaria sp. MPI-SDFR-AT-0083]|nr:hypothetical protein B0T09DRAFT_347841 [Sordaria sp. MPI-SDFR-AT-0083]
MPTRLWVSCLYALAHVAFVSYTSVSMDMRFLMLPLLSCIITLILNGPWSTKQQAWTSVHVKVSCCLAVQKPL